MKLIALRDFRNVSQLRLNDDGKSTVTDAKHDSHIHKGAVISIGDDKLKLNPADLMKLNKSDAAAAATIALLVHAGAVGDATDAKVIEAVKLSLAEDEKREKNAAKLDKATQNDALVQQLIAVLGGKQAAKASA